MHSATTYVYIGEFGIVYQGRLKNAFAEKSSQEVAVKTLKGK